MADKMITSVRILVNANGTQRLQMYCAEVNGFDESGGPHFSGRGWWEDVPVHRHWKTEADGSITVDEATGEAHHPTENRSAFENMIYRELQSIHQSGQEKYSSATDPVQRSFAKGWRYAALAVITKISEHQGVTLHDAMQRVYEPSK